MDKNEAIKIIRSNFPTGRHQLCEALETLIPELKESDDEQIKNEIIDYLKGFIPHHNDDLVAKSKLWIAWLEKQGEQKPADKVEPKFKVGDWITIDNPCQIISIDGNYIVQYCDDEKTHEISKKFCEFQFHLWIIQDAKSGDVLYYKSLRSGVEFIVMSRGINGYGNIDSYFRYNSECGFINVPSVLSADSGYITPATKEQRDLLFSKMKEAGYEWDAEKKELKKMKQKTTKLPKGEDYGIDSLYHAARILEKTLGDVEGYQSDDGILEHKCAIEAVNRLYKQKPAWSEEDKNMLQNILECLKNGWSKLPTDILKYESWLKSIKERYTWRPSDEQMEALYTYIYNPQYFNSPDPRMELVESVYKDLKKLKEE